MSNSSRSLARNFLQALPAPFRSVFPASFAMLIATALLVGCGQGADDAADADPDTRGELTRYGFTAGSAEGVYYPTAGAIARLARENHPLSLEVVSGGSVVNARRLANGEAQLAVIQNDIASYARNGERMFQEDGPNPAMLGVAGLYPEHVQLVVRADSDINAISDLQGRVVNLDKPGSGTTENARQVLDAAGLSEEDIEVRRLDTNDAVGGLQNGEIDAAFFTFGVGFAGLQQMASQVPVRILPIDGDIRAALLGDYDFYREAVVPAGAYPGVEQDVPTVSVVATWVADESVPAEHVEQMLSAVFNNIDQFRAAHARLGEVSPERAQALLTMPMHPGAEAFYASLTTGPAPMTQPAATQPGDMDAGFNPIPPAATQPADAADAPATQPATTQPAQAPVE